MSTSSSTWGRLQTWYPPDKPNGKLLHLKSFKMFDSASNPHVWEPEIIFINTNIDITISTWTFVPKCCSLGVNKDGRLVFSLKVKPKYLSMGHKSRLIHVGGWDMNQTKKSKLMLSREKMLHLIFENVKLFKYFFLLLQLE